MNQGFSPTRGNHEPLEPLGSIETYDDDIAIDMRELELRLKEELEEQEKRWNHKEDLGK